MVRAYALQDLTKDLPRRSAQLERLGVGSPSTRLIEIVAAVVLGASAAVLIYAIGRRLFDPRTGLLAAAALAVTPGHFLDRTLLGAADHHAAESVLVLFTLLIMVIALQAATSDPDTPTWRSSITPWVAGVALGAYCLTWTSAALFIATRPRLKPDTIGRIRRRPFPDGHDRRGGARRSR